jgi:hypothetical protein
MHRHWAYLFGCGLALPVLALVAGLQVPVVAASPHQPTTDVNRALKGNRLPSILTGTNASPSELSGRPAPGASPKLPDGCEAAVSAMTRSDLAHTPGRCIS